MERLLKVKKCKTIEVCEIFTAKLYFKYQFAFELNVN